MSDQAGKINAKGNRSKPNYFYSILSVALVLFLLGVFGMALLHMQGLVRYFKESVPFLIEIHNDAEQAEIFQFQKQLEGRAYIKKGTVKYIDREQAMQVLQKDLGEDAVIPDINPLQQYIEFNLKAEYIGQDVLSTGLKKEVDDFNVDQLLTEIKAKEFVRDVFYQEVVLESVESNIKRISILALILSAIFILITISLIFNTIKLALYSNRFLIKNMQLVGATRSFIVRPYVLRGISNGFLSGFLANAALVVVLYFIKQSFPTISSLISPYWIGGLFLLIFLIGIVISWWSTSSGVRKYLKMKLDDLY